MEVSNFVKALLLIEV